MTKYEATESLKEYSRNVVKPDLAINIAKAFGYTLADLDIQTRKTKDFQRMNYSNQTGDLEAVSISALAKNLCLKVTGIEVTSEMNGTGSYAQDITDKAVEQITAYEINKSPMGFKNKPIHTYKDPSDT
jgi:hypothetical protein